MLPYRAMIIYNDKSMRDLIEKVVTKEGFEAAVVSSGGEALALFREKPSDLLVIDLESASDAEGIKLLHDMKAVAPRMQSILITGVKEGDLAIMAIKEGVLDYLEKPLNVGALMVAIGRAKEELKVLVPREEYPTILIVEDDDQTRKHLVTALDREGWRVLNAPNGAEAIKIFTADKIDVVVSDIKMPGIDGIKLLTELKKLTDDFEAIVLTGYGDEDTVVKALRMGAASFLKKPVDLEQLIAIINNTIEKIMLRRSLKYRSRELHLAQQVIAKITTEGELLINVRKEVAETPGHSVRKLLDALSMGIVALDSGMKVRYVNANIQRCFEKVPPVFDGEFLAKLSVMGVTGLKFGDISERVKACYAAELGTVETIKFSQYGYAVVFRLLIVVEGALDKVTCLVFRGERK